MFYQIWLRSTYTTVMMPSDKVVVAPMSNPKSTARASSITKLAFEVTRWQRTTAGNCMPLALNSAQYVHKLLSRSLPAALPKESVVGVSDSHLG